MYVFGIVCMYVQCVCVSIVGVCVHEVCVRGMVCVCGVELKGKFLNLYYLHNFT